MPKKKTVILLILIVLLIITVPLLAVLQSRSAATDSGNTTTGISIWQIDGFEGGRGSRSQYLQSAGNACFKGKKIYVTVTSLSADAARANLAQGNEPDIISYPAGFYGIENYVNKKDFLFKSWCRGGYCILTLDESGDFSDISAENTVINAGKDNLSKVAAVLNGVSGARSEEPTNAYLNLLNGKFKYLFGTQRDVFRLKTRNVSFSVKPVTEFNDLYQNVSILTKNSSRYEICNQYINYLLKHNKVETLGLFFGECNVTAEELRPMAEVEFESVLN
ncbi:MAG: hypothetical protein K2O81_02590, partial [Clostridia bacterium]|nr:hypothetical protein [Clostridia bacterium]